MFAVTHAQAQSNRFVRTTLEGRRIWRSRYFGPAPSPEDSSSLAPEAGAVEYADPAPGELREPQAFLIEQEPGAIVQPHFHYVDQFQVVAAGGGLLGRHEMAPLSVHFAAACTGYGPIRPGDEGLSYFTFRASADETGAQYLPAARSRMRPGQRRNEVVDQIHLTPQEDLARRTESRLETALEHEDGLAVCLYRMAPGASAHAIDASLGRGVTLMVATGSLRQSDGVFPRWSCFFVEREEGRLPLQAGPEGAEVLMLRYPAG
ncbi:MAG: hypothetical protein WBF88_15205 [Pusillimonas sp.]